MNTKSLAVLGVCLAMLFAPLTQAAAQTQTAPRGATLRLILNDSLSSESNNPGDKFQATVAEDLKLNGRVVVPQGALVEGTVTQVEEAKRGAGVAGKAKLTLRFDRIRAHGESRALHATLLSVHDPVPGLTAEDVDDDDSDGNVDIDEESQIEAETDVKDILTKGAIGVAAGALLGALFGNVSRGVILGSIGGAIAILAPKGKDVTLKEGTGLRVRLDRDLTMSIT